MKRGVSGAPIPFGLPFSEEVTKACKPFDFPPCLAYAVRVNETDSGTDPSVMQIGSVDGLMPDGSNAGRGIFQETSSWAEHWDDPLANAVYAIAVFLQPDWMFWTENTDLEGEQLVKVIAVSFNAGRGAAWKAHLQGDTDSASTANYGARAVSVYRSLISNTFGEHGFPPHT